MATCQLLIQRKLFDLFNPLDMFWCILFYREGPEATRQEILLKQLCVSDHWTLFVLLKSCWALREDCAGSCWINLWPRTVKQGNTSRMLAIPSAAGSLPESCRLGQEVRKEAPQMASSLRVSQIGSDLVRRYKRTLVLTY